MGNNDAPFGLRVVRVGGSGAVRHEEFTIEDALADSIFLGDPVLMTGTGTNITVAPAGTNNAVGVFQGCHFIDEDGSPKFSKYWPGGRAATEIVAHVIVDPLLVFEIQTTALAKADVGKLADWSIVAGDTRIGVSKSVLDASGLANTGKSLRIIGLSKRENMGYGDHAVAEVVFAEHARLGTTSGVGGV